MTFDEEIYNPAALVGDDAKLMQGYDRALEDVSNWLAAEINDPDEELAGEVEPLRAIYSDCLRVFMQKLESFAHAQRVEMTAWMMDAKPDLYNNDDEKE